MSDKNPTVPARRLAAIDIGSNSIHLIVADAHPGRRFHIIDREKEMVRLAAGTLQTHYLSGSRMNAAIEALKNFVEIAKAMQAEPVLITATSAVREAWNRFTFLSRIEEEIGIEVEVLPGVEEARLIALAVAEVTDFQGQHALIIDIGGGSTEFIISNGRETRLLLSVKLGAVRLQEQFLRKAKATPPSRADVQAMVTYIRSSLARTVREIKQAGNFSTVIGTSGTILGLANAALEANTDRIEDRSRDFTPFSLKLGLGSLEALNKRLQRASLKERRKFSGLDSRRADIIVPGGVLLETILRELGIQEIKTCDWSLREGILLNYLHEHAPELMAVNLQPAEPAVSRSNLATRNPANVRARGVLAVAQRYEYEALHSQHTAFLACRLFDETKALHHLGAVERELLEYAAILHDIGYHIAHNSHHKHAMYLIRHAELPGLHSREIAILANIARYHRGSVPKKKHAEFHALDPSQRDMVRKLTALLRIADGLDRRHLGTVKNIQVKTSSKRVVIRAVAPANSEIEIWCAKRNAAMFETLFGVEVDVLPAEEPASGLKTEDFSKD
ncbi:MAG: Ppx/GppA family phosphatase [Blastocatellia bacterium]|nr:Ppx/GppA family phosphatase [Blastocatellia bacterium]